MYIHQTKVMRNANEDMISVEITRMGADLKTVSVPVDSTLEDVLEEAGMTLSSSESAWVKGDSAEFDSIIDDGDSIQIVGKKEGGLK